jgi:lysozyme family protein
MKIEEIIVAAADKSARFRKALAFTLRAECEFDSDGEIRCENVPGDSGGLTFAGIDHASHPNFPFDDPNPSDVCQVYWNSYWEACACDQLPTPVGEVVFVQAVNQGVGAAKRMLQFALNDYGAHLVVDGMFGPKTIDAAQHVPNASELAQAFLQKSRRRYQAIVAAVPGDAKFLNGWMNRLDGIQQTFIA